MKTEFSDALLATRDGARANEILRSCVHCGFCNATCPTYQITGDELDGPRGRIYLIKDLLEQDAPRERVTRHLDRCLTCRACETTCPSGVAYGELAEIGRNHLGAQRRGWAGRLRNLLRRTVPNAARLRTLTRLGRPFRWLLPARLATHVPARIGRPVKSQGGFERQVLLLNGCAQQVATADTNLHLARLLGDRQVGVVVAQDEGCCGALDLHLGAESAALGRVRANVRALHARLGEVEAIVSTASGCGVTVKDYARLLADDKLADQAREVSAKTLDVAEYLAKSGFELSAARGTRRVAWHAPCSLQHGQRVVGHVETLLEAAGYELVEVADPHLCCGSAGTYSILQPDMASELKSRKVEALTRHDPQVVATANVGCQTHLQSGTAVPVVHWIELLI